MHPDIPLIVHPFWRAENRDSFIASFKDFLWFVLAMVVLGVIVLLQMNATTLGGRI